MEELEDEHSVLHAVGRYPRRRSPCPGALVVRACSTHGGVGTEHLLGAHVVLALFQERLADVLELVAPELVVALHDVEQIKVDASFHTLHQVVGLVSVRLRERGTHAHVRLLPFHPAGLAPSHELTTQPGVDVRHVESLCVVAHKHFGVALREQVREPLEKLGLGGVHAHVDALDRVAFSEDELVLAQARPVPLAHAQARDHRDHVLGVLLGGEPALVAAEALYVEREQAGLGHAGRRVAFRHRDQGASVHPYLGLVGHLVAFVHGFGVALEPLTELAPARSQEFGDGRDVCLPHLERHLALPSTHKQPAPPTEFGDLFDSLVVEQIQPQCRALAGFVEVRDPGVELGAEED